MNFKKLRKYYKKCKGCECVIPISDIVITYDFQLTSPRYAKFVYKERQFLEYGFLNKIILNNNFELIDGYCSYLICKKYGINKVSVYFED